MYTYLSRLCTFPNSLPHPEAFPPRQYRLWNVILLSPSRARSIACSHHDERRPYDLSRISKCSDGMGKSSTPTADCSGRRFTRSLRIVKNLSMCIGGISRSIWRSRHETPQSRDPSHGSLSRAAMRPMLINLCPSQNMPIPMWGIAS